MPENQEIKCKKCHRRLLPSQNRGSFTSYLLADLSCNCGQRKEAETSGGRDSQGKFCKRCQKVISNVQRVGSVTAFFFRDMRCHCEVPLIVTAADAKNSKQPILATRFHGRNLTDIRRKMRHATIMYTRDNRPAGDAAAFMELSPGQLIGGSYELMALSGEGGMGSVYRARHKVLGRECAIKFLAPSMVSEETWQLFQKEAKIISALNHNTICHIYDLGIHLTAGDPGALPYYAMDYIQGETLDQAITEQGPLSLGAGLELFIKVCEGLSYAHRRGVIHKDIKPANIMLTGAGTTAGQAVEVKILDFGISDLNDKPAMRANIGIGTGTGSSVRKPAKRSVDATQNNKNNKNDDGEMAADVIGSSVYMSPEQWRGRHQQPIDQRSDIYNLGATMYETLTGHPPFDGKTDEDMRRAHLELPPPLMRERTGMYFPLEIEAIVQKCLAKSPEARYQTASELMIDLERLQAEKAPQFAIAEIEALRAKEEEEGKGSKNNILTSPVTILLSILCLSILLAGVVLLPGVLNKPKEFARTAVDELDAAQNAMPRPALMPKAFDGTKAPGEKIASNLGYQVHVKPDGFFVKESKSAASGKQIVEYKFDEKTSIGQCQRYNERGQLDTSTCFNRLTFTAGLPLYFAPDPNLSNLHEVCLGFRNQDLNGLILSNRMITVDENSEIYDELEKISQDRSYIERIVLTSEYVNPKLTAILPLFSGLQALKISNWSDIPRDNAGKPALRLEKIPTVTHLQVERFQGKLKNLFSDPAARYAISDLMMINTPMTGEDMQTLLAFPNLKTLQIYKCSPKASSIEPLYKSNVAILKIFERKDPSSFLSAEKLAKMPQLRQVTFEIPANALDNVSKFRQTMRQLNPNIAVRISNIIGNVSEEDASSFPR